MPTARELVTNFSDIQTMPHVALKVNELARSNSSSMQDFEAVIKMDPVLVTRLLRLVNSAYYGSNKKIDSISRAATLVGMKELSRLVSVDAMKSFFKEEKDNAKGFSRSNLWTHSVTVALLAERIAKNIFGKNGEEAFLAGILHDIGLIVEDQVAGDLLREAVASFQNGANTLINCEKEFIGSDHCLVGALLTEEWDVSQDVLDAVWRHHRDIDAAPISSLASIIQIADYFAARLKYAVVPGRIPPLPSPALTEHVRNKINEYKELVAELPAAMSKAKEFFELN